MDKNEKILIGLILIFVVIPIILIGLYNIGLVYLVSKDETSVEVFSEDLRNKFMEAMEIENSTTFKPTHFSFEDPSGPEYYSYYDLIFEISKDECDDNNLSFETEDNFDTLSYGAHREEKDDDTYLCHAKITKTYNSVKYEKLEKIYNEIHDIKPKESVNYELEQNDNTSDLSNAGTVNSPGISDEFWKEYDKAVDNLNSKYFVTDFSNYSSGSTMKNLSTNEVSRIASFGFKESASRIAGEGAEDSDTETIEVKEIVPNNYFTRKHKESDDAYPDLKMEAYVVTRENDMGNGIKIYIDPTTALIVGGEAFGD